MVTKCTENRKKRRKRAETSGKTETLNGAYYGGKKIVVG